MWVQDSLYLGFIYLFAHKVERKFNIDNVKFDKVNIGKVDGSISRDERRKGGVIKKAIQLSKIQRIEFSFIQQWRTLSKTKRILLHKKL